MLDPLAILPADKAGLKSGFYKFIKHGDVAEAERLGWRPVKPRDGARHHDVYSVLCAPPRNRPMLLPGMTRTQRAIGWARFLLGRERNPA